MSPDALQISDLRRAYREGTLSPGTVVADLLRRIAAYPDKAVWINRVPDAEVVARAAALAAKPEQAHSLPLYGIPFAVKDNIDVAGLPTTAACPAFASTPTKSAAVVQRLVDAGAIVIGKTNLDQFATGLVGTRSPYGAPRCVFDDRFISGGSSSGSAVAVAAGLVAFALGTDTAGSGRVPAGFNNIVGLKPTKGLLSTTGLVPACRSIDCISVFATTCADALDVLAVTEGFDPSDGYSRAATPVRLPSDRFRFGVLAEADREFCGDAAMASLYDTAIERLTALGGEAVTFDYAPFREAALLLYNGPFVVERLAGIENFFAGHAEEMDPSVRSIVAGARRFSATDVFKGEYRLRALGQLAGAQFASMDVMLLPTSPTIFPVAEVEAEPIRLNSLLGTYTNFVNLLDFSAIAVPAGFRNGDDPMRHGLPGGVTLVGPAFADRDLAVLGDRLHRALDGTTGRARLALSPDTALAPEATAEILLAVAGAHLSGMPLNGELQRLGATLVRATTTAPDYKLMALKGTLPPKPGLVHTPGFAGRGIEVEIWSLTADAFGRFVAGLPQPMGVGKVTLADGSVVPGFLCETHALQTADDITAFGGWRAFVNRPRSAD